MEVQLVPSTTSLATHVLRAAWVASKAPQFAFVRFRVSLIFIHLKWSRIVWEAGEADVIAVGVLSWVIVSEIQMAPQQAQLTECLINCSFGPDIVCWIAS